MTRRRTMAQHFDRLAVEQRRVDVELADWCRELADAFQSGSDPGIAPKLIVAAARREGVIFGVVETGPSAGFYIFRQTPRKNLGWALWNYGDSAPAAPWPIYPTERQEDLLKRSADLPEDFFGR